MSSTQEGSSGVKGKEKVSTGSRRSWTQNEEAILIASLKDLIVTGWKSDNGFRSGYLKKLEAAMKNHDPNTDLKGLPHINSKLTTWKKNYYSLSSILSRSGVGFNVNGSYKIDCEDETWEQVVKVDPNARSMRYKIWPYYDEWKEIFGKDRANGSTAEDIADAWNGIREEENTEEGGMRDDYSVSLEDLGDNDGTGDSVSHTQKGTQLPHISTKKRKVSDDVSNLCGILVDFGRKTDERLASLADSIGYESRLGQAAEDAFEQLGKIEGLSLEQRFDVCEILSANIDKVKIFKGLPDSARPQYVERLLLKKQG